MPHRYVLLDRDGTLIVEKGYLADPDGVELVPGAAGALAALRERGWGAVVVTNQSGVGRGYFTAAAAAAVNREVVRRLREAGAEIDGVYSCPDAPGTPSTHRKPEPGMAIDAARDLGFDLTQSVVVGDKPADVELARRIGAMAVLVRTGYGRESEPNCRPDAVIDSIADLPAVLEGR